MGLKTVNDGYEYNINVSGRQRYHESPLLKNTLYLKENEKLRAKVNEVICDLDLGIDFIEYEEMEGIDDDGDKENINIPKGMHKSKRG
jgi:hypothetical protein